MSTSSSRLGFRSALVGVLAALGLLAPGAPAQLVNDGETNVLDNVTNIIAGGVTVGANAPFTWLTLTNGALLTSSGYNVIGATGNANSNQVLVTGTNSRWLNDSDLSIGDLGSANALLLSDGGRVATSNGYVGRYLGADQNHVVVSDSNSTWANIRSVYVGYSAAFNTVVISNGGLVSDANGYVGLAAASSNNRVIVTGANSHWTNGSAFVGQSGSFNELLVTNGGRMSSFYGFVGQNPGSSHNQAIVAGINSRWINESDFYVGVNGEFNSLLITKGGTVAAGQSVVGNAGKNNQVTVSDPNSLWSIAGDLTVGGSGSSFNTLVITNGGRVANAVARLGRYPGANSNMAVITGANSLWSNSGNLYVGESGSCNRLIVKDGGTVRAASIVVGANPSATNNVLWLDNGTLTVFGGGLTINNDNTLAGSGTINGNLFLNPSASAVFEIGGRTATNGYDQLNVANFVQFGGTLVLVLTNGFLPAPGDTFTLVKFASSSGMFSNAIDGSRVTLANGLASFLVSYGNDLVLSDVQYLDMDSDGDGQGDLQELAAGTDPNNSASVLAITSITGNASGQVVVQFQSATNKTYRIEYSASPEQWSIAITNVPSAGTSTTWIDDGSLTGGLPVNQRFYRVGLQ